MSGLFQGLEIGKRSLLTQQLSMFTASHNIANVNTPGFARQRAILGSTMPLDLPGGRIGTGVTTLTINQLRDTFVDFQFRREYNSLGGWQAQNKVLSQIELVFTEPQDHTLGDLMTKFWSTWQQLANEPTGATRTAVAEQAGLLVNGFHTATRQLDNLESSLNTQLKSQAATLNEMGMQLALLNEQIARGELGGQSANDLRDKRNLILDELSRLAQVTIEPTATGAVNVYIGSMEFVNRHEFHEIKAVTSNNASKPKVELVWGYSGQAVRFTGGELHSTQVARDVWLPESREALDRLAQTLVTQVNSLHRQGTTAGGRIGQSFFDPLYVTADRIQLHSMVADNPQENIAAGRTTAESDVEIAQALADLAETPVLPDGRTTLNGYWDSVVATVGMRSMEAQDVTETQTLLVEQLEYHRQSVMGASLDEELANMIKFQHAYEAAARVITTMDEAINTVVNGMGLVGR